MPFTPETATEAARKGHAALTPAQRADRARKAQREGALRTALRMTTTTPEVFTPAQRREMVDALSASLAQQEPHSHPATRPPIR